MKSVLDLHLKTRTADLNKYNICYKMPYQYKKKVLQAVILSSLLYGCKTWLNDQLKAMEQLYISAIKSLLG